MRVFVYIATIVPVVIYFNIYPLNEDSYWIIYSTEYMLKGATLYIDIVETNPPLIFLISMLPVKVAHYFSLQMTTVYIAYVTLLSFFSYHLVRQLLLESKRFNSVQTELISYMSLVVLLLVPSGDFAQREHFMVIFVLPYIIMSMLNERRSFTSTTVVSVALFAALGFNLKPHFFLLFIILELLHVRKMGSLKYIFRKEIFIISISALVYLLFIYVFFREYIDFAIPLAIEAYSGVFNGSFTGLIFNYDMMFGLISIVYIAIFAYKRERSDLTTLLLAILGFLTIYFMQHKGWHYHILPFTMITTFSVLYVMVVYIKREDYKFLGIWVVVLIMILNQNIYVNRFTKLHETLSKMQKNVPVVIYTTQMAMGLPIVVRNSQEWASRFLSLWMLPKISFHPEDSFFKKYLLEAIYDDLKKFKPEYIIFPTYYDDMPYYDFFVNHSPLIKGIIVKEYTKQENKYFEIYERKDLESE